MKPKVTNQVAAIANQFIQHARYKLTPREQKLILYMATLIRPDDSDFETYLVPVSEIEYILKSDESKKHGSFYERLDALLDSITDKKITFPTDFTLDGVRLRGHINWVAGAIPKYNEDGILCVEFGFSPQMKPFMLGLKEKFTRIEFLEVAKMKSGFSIRIFQMCKSYYYENIRHGRDTLAVGIRELKQRLGIEDKYPDFRNFRRKVLETAQNEINDKTSLVINYDYIRRGRKITDIHIKIGEKEGIAEGEPKVVIDISNKSNVKNRGLKKRIENLTEAQRRGFNTLSEYGINISIILDEILPIIKGSEVEGYEDYFAIFMLAFFEKKTNRASQKEKVKAFVGWLRNKRFEEPGLYARLMEQVISKKKSLGEEVFANRERAKKMTSAAFKNLMEEERAIGKNYDSPFSVARKTKAQAKASRVEEIAELFQKEELFAFDFEKFTKEHPEVYRRIKREREMAFKHLKKISNYPQLLLNSVMAYCEQWMGEQGK